MSNPVYVTAFLDIGRHSWNNIFRCSNDVYLKHLDNLITYVPNIIIYLDGNDYDVFFAKYGAIIQKYNQDETFMSWCLNYEQNIVKNEQYLKEIKHRLQFPEHTIPLYTAVNHNKVHFLKRTKNMYPDFSHYIWIDSHYLRHNDIPIFIESSINNKIVIGSSRVQENLTPFTPRDIMKSGFDHMQGSVFIVPTELVEVIHDEYKFQLEQNYNDNIMDDDQGIHLAIYQRHPEIYKILYTGNFGKFFKVYRTAV